MALDVNILVSAFHQGAPDHDEMRTWLEGAVNGPEAVGVSTSVLAGALRILTHPAIFDPPVAPEEALGLLDDLVPRDVQDEETPDTFCKFCNEFLLAGKVLCVADNSRKPARAPRPGRET